MAKKKNDKAIDAVIKATLEKQIGEQVWNVLKDHIDKDVYGEYLPAGRWVWGTPQDSRDNGYQRRKTTGLLNKSDKSITVNHSLGGNTWNLRVTTNAQTSSVLGDKWDEKPGGLLALLESGNLGFWSRTMEQHGIRGVTHRFPRPVITNAQEEAEGNMKQYYAEVVTAIKKAMSERM